MQRVQSDCDCDVIHKEVVDEVSEQMPDLDLTARLTTFYKIMGDSTRVRILWALDKHELCVCDLAFLLNMTKSAVSHQLKLLFDTKLVRRRKEGKNVFYSLNDDHVKEIFEVTVTHLCHPSDES